MHQEILALPSIRELFLANMKRIKHKYSEHNQNYDQLRGLHPHARWLQRSASSPHNYEASPQAVVASPHRNVASLHPVVVSLKAVIATLHRYVAPLARSLKCLIKKLIFLTNFSLWNSFNMNKALLYYKSTLLYIYIFIIFFSHIYPKFWCVDSINYNTTVVVTTALYSATVL